jgi:hypothetical protein
VNPDQEKPAEAVGESAQDNSKWEGQGAKEE